MSADAASAWPAELYLVRGDDRRQLLERSQQLRRTIAQGRDPAACAAQLAAEPAARLTLACIADSGEQLLHRLESAERRLADGKKPHLRDTSGIYFEERPLGREGKIAYLFPGEGAQYLGMLHDVHEAFPIVRDCVALCDQLSAKANDHRGSLRRFLLRLPPDEQQAAEQDLRALDNAMYAVLAADWALASLLQQASTPPQALAGHSAGELAALLFAAAMEPEDQLETIVKAMRTLEDRAQESFSLLAVGANRDFVRGVLEQLGRERPLRAEVAMDNCPHQVVVVGAAEDVALVERALQAQNKMVERLALAGPYHTPLFEPFMDVLRNVFAPIPFQTPVTPVYSCTTGEPFPADADSIRSLCVEHWRHPVAFVDTIRNLHRDGFRLFVEVGPRGNLTSFAADTLRGLDAAAIACNVPRRHGVTQFLHALAQLAAHGAPVRLDLLYAQRGVTPDAGGQVAATQPGPPAAPRDSAERTLVVDAHLRLMEQFLEQQRTVMQGYLAAAGRGGAGRTSRPTRKGGAALRRAAASRIPPSAARRLQPPVPVPPPSPRSASPTAGAVPTSSAAPTNSSPPATKPRPMVGRIIEQRPGEQVVTLRELRLDYDHYAGHHTVGGRKLSRVDPNQHGLPIVPMTFTVEMMAECGELVFPELQVLRVENIQMMRWLAVYAERPHTYEVTATALEHEADSAERRVLIRIKDLGREGDENARQWMAAIGTVVLAPERPPAPTIDALELSNERPCEIDIPTMYNNLFHGELFQGVLSLGRFGEEGIEGRIEVLPRDELFGGLSDPDFISDPVLLDVAMHPPCAWHLSQPDQWGRIVLPFELQQVEFFGGRPEVGSQFTARTRIVEATPRHFTHVTETYDDQGRIWARINRVKLWRFYLPFRDVNFHGPKDVYIISEDFPEAVPDAWMDSDPPQAWCMRFDPLDDLRQRGLLSVAAQASMSPAELERFQRLDLPIEELADWVFVRMAAKDAVRVLWRKHQGDRLFMADVELQEEANGKFTPQLRESQRPERFPYVAVGACEGIIVSLASLSPAVGVAVARLDGPATEAAGAVQREEQELLEGLAFAEDAAEWRLRTACGKQALAAAAGDRGDASAYRLIEAAPDGLLTFAAPPANDAAVDPPPLAHVATRRWKNYITAALHCLHEADVAERRS